MAWFLVVAAAAVIVVAGYLVVRSRGAERPSLAHFRCPRCGLKMRYRADNQARRVTCPRCMRTCTLPGADPERGPGSLPAARSG
jgi:hypothetical protein